MTYSCKPTFKSVHLYFCLTLHAKPKILLDGSMAPLWRSLFSIISTNFTNSTQKGHFQIQWTQMGTKTRKNSAWYLSESKNFKSISPSGSALHKPLIFISNNIWPNTNHPLESSTKSSSQSHSPTHH